MSRLDERLAARLTHSEAYVRSRNALQARWRDAILERDDHRCRACGFRPRARAARQASHAMGVSPHLGAVAPPAAGRASAPASVPASERASVPASVPASERASAPASLLAAPAASVPASARALVRRKGSVWGATTGTTRSRDVAEALGAADPVRGKTARKVTPTARPDEGRGTAGGSGVDAQPSPAQPCGLEIAHVTDVSAFVRAARDLAGVTFSFRWDNLVTLCSTCHRASHRELGRLGEDDLARALVVDKLWADLRRVRGWSSPYAALPPHLVPPKQKPRRSFHDVLRVSPLVPFPTFQRFVADGGPVWADEEAPAAQTLLADWPVAAEPVQSAG